MLNKVKRFGFSEKFLNKGLDINKIEELFTQLPLDAKICSFNVNPEDLSTSVLVHSEQFEEVPEGSFLNKPIVIKFKN